MIFILKLCPPAFWLFSESASNFGVFIGGLGTLVLSGVGVFTLISWRHQKSAERKSDLALDFLNQIVDFEIRYSDLLSSIWFVYDRDAPANADRVQAQSRDSSFKLSQLMDRDPWELRNFASRVNAFIKDISKLGRVGQLLDDSILMNTNKIESDIKLIAKNLNIYLSNIPGVSGEAKAEAYGKISSMQSDKSQAAFAEIRSKLKKIIFYKKINLFMSMIKNCLRLVKCTPTK